MDFNRDVRPILSRHCTACHGGVKQAGGISFVYRDKAMGTAKSGAVPIVPGNPAASEIIRRVTTDNEEDRMPPRSHAEGARLTPDEVGKLRAWIAAGAPWGAHWSHRKPVAPPAPRVGKADWTRQALDGYVLEQMEAAGLEPGFLIGGVPGNFDVSARLGRGPFFVIEADEYDTAFFDKRAKFVHYRPRTLILDRKSTRLNSSHT